MAHSAEFVIVGAGSAGCVLAGQLARAGRRVLLIEAGPDAGPHPEILRADGFKDAFANESLMWHRMSKPAAGSDERSVFIGTGRGMGGSGSVNGMVYTRPDASDFSRWPGGWSWHDVTPAFAGVEAVLQPSTMQATPFLEAFMQGAQALGLERRDGLMDGHLGNVVGSNALNHDGQSRNSSYRKWLHDQHFEHLTVRTGCQVLRIEFDEAEGTALRAVGLHVRENGAEHALPIHGELILCAGALETPRLLMLSGVGPAGVLQHAGVPVRQDAPGVGQHLKDHPNVPVFFRGRKKVDFAFPQVYAFDAVAHAMGLSAPGHDVTAATDRKQPSAAESDVCYVCYSPPSSLKESMLRMLPVLALPGRLHDVAPLRKTLRALVHLAFMLAPLRAWLSQVFAVVVILGKPRSTGHIEIVSANADVPARVVLSYLSDAHDRRVFDAAVQRALTLVSRSGLGAVNVLSRGAAALNPARRWSWLRKAMLTTYHFCGTCRMGEDAASPVTSDLRLKGHVNVRIADASVVPEIPVCATNATSMMVAWRAADFVLKGHA